MGARWCNPTPRVLCVCSPSKASSEPSTAACLHATVSAHCAKGTDQTHTSEAVFIELLVVLHIARLKDILAVLPYSASRFAPLAALASLVLGSLPSPGLPLPFLLWFSSCL